MFTVMLERGIICLAEVHIKATKYISLCFFNSCKFCNRTWLQQTFVLLHQVLYKWLDVSILSIGFWKRKNSAEWQLE